MIWIVGTPVVASFFAIIFAVISGLTGFLGFETLWPLWALAVPGGTALFWGTFIAGFAVRRIPPLTPSEIQQKMVAHFKNLVNEYRDVVLGDYSDFNKLRTKLEQAREETTQSLEYWQERNKTEEVIDSKKRLKIARRIKKRLDNALTSLEKQKEGILEFFRHYEKQLSKVEGGVNDYFEDQRLIRLSTEAEKLTEESETIALRIASSFIEDASRLQQALGQIHENTLFTLAENSEIEDLETIADKVIAFEPENILAIKQLEVALEGQTA